MDSDNITKIITALISLFGVVLGAVLGYISRSKKQTAIDAQREQKQADNFSNIFKEMSEIKKRLDSHNEYAKKFGEIEISLATIKKDIEYIRKETHGKGKEK